jgi:diacylglycerol O-acyltransferase / wax synthase
MPRQLPVGADGANGNADRGRRRATRRPRGDDGHTDTKNPAPNNRLSALDAAFLYLERKEIPLHMASVCVFDGPIPFDEFVASIDSKLHLIPRYRQVAVVPPYNLGEPTWEDDPHFDIHRHIFRVSLNPPGGRAQLEALVGRILSQLMDRSQPLWDLHVVDGLKDGRGALIVRIHHALADGISGTALLRVMLNPTPECSHAIRKTRFRPPKPQPTGGSLTDAISKVVQGTMESLIGAETVLVGFAQALLTDSTRNDLKGLLDLLPEMAQSMERLPFNEPCSGDRKFRGAEFDFADVQAIRQTAGGTVNDVILTVLTRALARYVKLHRQSVVNRFVRIICPVNLRRGNQQEGVGNQVSFLPVALPMDVQDPVQMLRTVANRTDTMKRGKAADLVALAASCIAAAPPLLQALFWKGITQVTLPLPLFNIICTNVGEVSPVPLFAAGRRMIAYYPQVPTGYEFGVGCAVQSYDGKLFFGLSADALAAPDVSRLRDFLYVSFRELCRSAGVKKARRRVGTRAQAARPAEPAPAVASESPAQTTSEVPAQAPPETPPDTVPALLVVPSKDAAFQTPLPGPKHGVRRPPLPIGITAGVSGGRGDGRGWR